ncbi:hypothetical protein RJ639_024035 [Escallonia herrerae]|uniref:Uncharacterized protein n=1 Tax=Escallonia herrerae TaxID=1293975 RepID=A0AA89AEK1_9ASTE|nr:hypothetical protein RJ639_024035 [Escallonia herrerae]
MKVMIRLVFLGSVHTIIQCLKLPTFSWGQFSGKSMIAIAFEAFYSAKALKGDLAIEFEERLMPSRAIGNLSKLEELYLGENDLRGRIPQEMSNLIGLTLLSIPYNRLEGPIPVGIWNISSLQMRLKDEVLANPEDAEVDSDLLTSCILNNKNGF